MPLTLDTLHETAAAAVGQALSPGELLITVIPGELKQALVGTDRRVFVFKSGIVSGSAFGKQINSWDYVNISGVEVRKTMTSNAIVLQVPGVTPVTKYGRFDNGQASVWEAPNAVMTSAKGFDRGVAAIRKHIAEAQTPPRDLQVAPADAVAQLRQLAELRDQGVLSDVEFATMKARIVAGQ